MKSRSRVACVLVISGCVACGAEDSIRLGPTPSSPGGSSAPGVERPSPTPLRPDGTQPAVPEGGQSGTDAEGEEAAPPCNPPPVWFDEALRWDGVLVRALLDSAARKYTLRGDLYGEPARLDLELTLVNDPAPVGEPEPNGTAAIYWCGAVIAPARVAVTITPDDPERATLSLTTSSAQLTLGDDGNGWLQFAYDAPTPPEVQPALYDAGVPAPVEFVPGSHSTGVALSYSKDPLSGHRVIAERAEFQSSSPRIGPFYRWFEFPQRMLLPECQAAPAESAGRTAFGSSEEALAAVVGRWVLCGGERVDVAGVEIFPDGTWHAIVDEDGGLRLGAGFEREGVVRAVDISEPYGAPGDFALELLQPNRWWFAAAPALQFSASGTGFGGIDFHELMKLERPVAPVIPPAFAAGERAGQAACASSEAGLEPFATSEAELQANLRGDWIGCAGYFGQLHFDGQGNAEFAETPTDAAHAEAYQVVETLGTAATLRVRGETWHVVRSASPVKLWVRRFEENPVSYDPEVIVFSAL